MSDFLVIISRKRSRRTRDDGKKEFFTWHNTFYGKYKKASFVRFTKSYLKGDLFCYR